MKARIESMSTGAIKLVVLVNKQGRGMPGFCVLENRSSKLGLDRFICMYVNMEKGIKGK